MATRGYGAPEVAATYHRARELCEQAEDTAELFPVLWGLWLLYQGRAEQETAQEFGEQCLSLARRLDDGVCVAMERKPGKCTLPLPPLPSHDAQPPVLLAA